MSRDMTVVVARAKSAAAKARLEASVANARHRLSPRTLASDAADGAKDRIVEAAQSGLKAARDRPAIVAAALGVVGMFLARKPLAGWVEAKRGTRESDAS